MQSLASRSRLSAPKAARPAFSGARPGKVSAPPAARPRPQLAALTPAPPTALQLAKCVVRRAATEAENGVAKAAATGPSNMLDFDELSEILRCGLGARAAAM
jgi:hypothetical protein